MIKSAGTEAREKSENVSRGDSGISKQGEIKTKIMDSYVDQISKDLHELSDKTLKSYTKKAHTSADRAWKKIDKEEDASMSTDGTKYPDKQARHTKNADDAYKVWKKRTFGISNAKKKITNEDVELTQEEIDFIESTLDEDIDLDEGKRGRPPKEGSQAWKDRVENETSEPGMHIMNQLQKAKISLQGGIPIHFKNGDKVHVSGNHASKILTKYGELKPTEKEEMQKELASSHENFKKHL
jgi:hypothetical protein